MMGKQDVDFNLCGIKFHAFNFADKAVIILVRYQLSSFRVKIRLQEDRRHIKIYIENEDDYPESWVKD